MERKILVFAPHQDDEVLHCAGVLKKAVQQGADIRICFATNGEYEDEALAAVRSRESLTALAKLGVTADAAVFLGYADTGMPPRDSFFYRLFLDQTGITLPSCWGKTETWLPDGMREYRFLKDGVHSPYTRAAVLRDITDLLREFRPDEIYVTAPCDLHGDHAALGAFVSEALAALTAESTWRPKLYHFLIHTADEKSWPPRTGDFFPEPADSCALGLDWAAREVRPLPDGFTAQDKYNLLFTYASQDPHAYDDYLIGFAKAEELFFPADPTKPVTLAPITV